MPDELESIALQLHQHPIWNQPHGTAGVPDLRDPAWLGYIAVMLLDAGGVVPADFNPETMARDLLLLWNADRGLVEWLDARKDAIRSGQIDPKTHPACGGADGWGC